MKTAEWRAELKRLERRLMKIRAAMSGNVVVKRVEVKRVKVRAHTRAAHTRLIISSVA